MTSTREPRNVFVIAPTKLHFEELKTVRGVGERFHLIPLLDFADVVHVEELHIGRVVDKARAQLDAFGGRVDAIIAHWDFPTTLLAPMLSRERGCRAPSVDSVVQCGHKYWSRVAQRRALGDETPRFALVDPFDPDAARNTELPYPFWLKPVKAFSSQLGFRIESRLDFERALEEIRAEIPRIACIETGRPIILSCLRPAQSVQGWSISMVSSKATFANSAAMRRIVAASIPVSSATASGAYF